MLTVCVGAAILAALRIGRASPLPWPGGQAWPVVAVLGGAGLAVRIRAEERRLTDALGAQYQRSAAERKRLVPGVW